MPLPEPDLTGEGYGAGACCGEEGLGGERHGCGAEGSAAKVDEGEDEEEFEGVDGVVADLGCGDIEAEEVGRRKAEEGGAAEDGVDADEEADGDAPGELLRGGAHAEESEDREREAAIGPVVVDGSEARVEIGEIVFARLH